MIHLTQTQPQSGELKKLKDWLTRPEAEIFLKLLSHQEAVLLVQAVNDAAGPDPDATTPLDVREKIQEAKKIRFMIELITSARSGDQDWQIVDIRPQPVLVAT